MVGSPLFMAIAFSLVALWAVLLGIQAFRRPPPGFEPRLCFACNKNSKHDATKCEHCGAPLPPREPV